MNSIHSIPIRILVTGSRGKSSLVRLLSAALVSFGLKVRGRITGVLPRELLPGDGVLCPLKETLLLRSGPASVEEMRWWLSTLPRGTDAVVMENSAVAPELQSLAFRWLQPGCTVLTNIRPDHEEIWGRGGRENAAYALCSGIGDTRETVCTEHPVVLPRSVAEKPCVHRVLSARRCRLLPCDEGKSFKETHFALVEEVCRIFGFDVLQCRSAAAALPPDLADFALFHEGEGISCRRFFRKRPRVDGASFLLHRMEQGGDHNSFQCTDRPCATSRNVSPLAALLPLEECLHYGRPPPLHPFPGCVFAALRRRIPCRVYPLHGKGLRLR